MAGKGSQRRREDTAAIRQNWDKIRWTKKRGVKNGGQIKPIPPP